MIQNKVIELPKVRKDLTILDKKVKDCLKSIQNARLETDEEFKRMWSEYGKIRNALIEIDAKLFTELRDLSLPDPDRSLYHGPGQGLYLRHHVEPLANELEKAIEYLHVYEEENTNSVGYEDPLKILNLIAQRFHKMARQLRNRHSGRETLSIKDEYDLQDFLHVVLMLYFDDIRPEEWTPSYAGSSSRMDFLLKQQRVVVETKMGRQGLDAKKLGEELIVDIQKYQKHPDCKQLFCFVYDPDGWIANPKGIENDLARSQNGFDVFVTIEPKG